MKETQDILRAFLSPEEFNTLTRLTRGWTAQPFEYHSDTGTVEINDRWLRRLERTQEYQDLFFRACDILSREAEALPELAGKPEGGTMTLKFFFAESEEGIKRDAEVGRIFLRLLGNMGPDYVVLHHEPGEQALEVVVKVHFHTDWDLFHKKEELYNLLEIAQRKKDQHPFHGQRL